MSVHRIKGQDGVILESNTFLELPKAQTKTTTFIERAGMIRYNIELKAFEGVLEFDDGSLSYRRFPNLDSNGKLSSSQLPDSVVSGMQYMGTYSPLSDDIDPPLSDVVWNSLPNPTSTNTGQYFIVRSIMDAAITHYDANTPSTSPVIFTPVNPSGQGNWLQIKYYFGVDPLNSSQKIVTSAFGRIIVASIPSTGHDGLVSLSTDVELTNAFTNANNPSAETALTDGDWVISTGTVQQRLRSTRTSIGAGQVSFDRTISIGTGRSFKSNSGTAQTVIDNLILNTIRRTGDSMYNDGNSPAEGRFALVYGSAAKPSLTFSVGDDDISTDSGMDPSKWTDAGTGLFRQAAGSIGFSSNTTEKFRIENTRVILFQNGSTNVTTNTALQFNHSSNTSNVGISGLNNTISFSTNNLEQVKFANGLSTFNGAVTVTGNTILGTTSSNTLTVNSTSTFVSPVTVSSTFTTTGTDNYFNSSVRINQINGIKLVSNQADTTGVVKIYYSVTGGVRFDMTSPSTDISIMDGANIRTAFNQYGVKLPILNPVDDSKGVDGMIAYAPSRASTVQKINGSWVNIGAGSNTTIDFVKADWVNSSGYYTYTITRDRILDVRVQELVTGNFIPVEVDSITISTTDAILRIPNTSDLRFDGRVVISQGA